MYFTLSKNHLSFRINLAVAALQVGIVLLFLPSPIAVHAGQLSLIYAAISAVVYLLANFGPADQTATPQVILRWILSTVATACALYAAWLSVTSHSLFAQVFGAIFGACVAASWLFALSILTTSIVTAHYSKKSEAEKLSHSS